MSIKRTGEIAGSLITFAAMLSLAFNVSAQECGVACQSDLSDINDALGKIVKLKKDKKNRRRKPLGAGLPESEISLMIDPEKKGRLINYKGTIIRFPNTSSYTFPTI